LGCDAETTAALQPMVRSLSTLVKEVREELSRAAGAVGVVAGAAHAAAVRGVAHLQGLARARQPAHAVQRAGGLVLASAISESERKWAALTRDEGALVSHGCSHPGRSVYADDAIPSAAEGLPLTTLNPLRGTDQLPDVPWRSHRSAASESSGRGRRRLPIGLSIVGARGQ